MGSADSSFTYVGDWSTSSGGSGKQLGDDHYSDTPGSSFTHRFRGTSVSLFGTKAQHHGEADVVVNGGVTTVIDQYAQQRQENVLFFSSPVLPHGDHVVTVTVRGTRSPPATGAVVSVNRAVVPSTATREPEPPRPFTTVFEETGNGPEQRPYAATMLNDTHERWHVEPGSSPVDRAGGQIAKVDGERFHRMFSTRRLGGPGKTLRITYRARLTELRAQRDTSIVAGAKLGLKFPVSAEITGFSKDDPRSVHGTDSQDNDESPGSYAFLTGLTDRGYLELARNGYGDEGYSFWDSKRVGYSPGDWRDVVITVEWLAGSSIRVRFWHNADGTGEPVYEATDHTSPFAAEPGFLWLRTDNADWEYDFITVEER